MLPPDLMIGKAGISGTGGIAAAAIEKKIPIIKNVCFIIINTIKLFPLPGIEIRPHIRISQCPGGA